MPLPFFRSGSARKGLIEELAAVLQFAEQFGVHNPRLSPDRKNPTSSLVNAAVSMEPPGQATCLNSIMTPLEMHISKLTAMTEPPAGRSSRLSELGSRPMGCRM
jgi:hypothetical protein